MLWNKDNYISLYIYGIVRSRSIMEVCFKYQFGKRNLKYRVLLMDNVAVLSANKNTV